MFPSLQPGLASPNRKLSSGHAANHGLNLSSSVCAKPEEGLLVPAFGSDLTSSKTSEIMQLKYEDYNRLPVIVQAFLIQVYLNMDPLSFTYYSSQN